MISLLSIALCHEFEFNLSYIVTMKVMEKLQRGIDACTHTVAENCGRFSVSMMTQHNHNDSRTFQAFLT